MRKSITQILCLLLSVILLLSPVSSVGAYELGNPWAADLTDFMENEEKREYVQMMLDYYLRSDTKIQEALESGQCAMFLFEGCSDNMDDPELSDLTYYRVSAACIVLKLDKRGKPAIVYYNENCSTLPDRALEYGAWYFEGFGDVGPATICDGTFELYSVEHGGNYEALHLRDSAEDGELAAVYMFEEGYITADATLINIHTRTGNHTISRGMWSAGCMLVGDGDFGQFTELMACTYYSIYDTFEVGRKVGTVTINRLLLQEELYELYENTGAVDTLLAHSRCLLPELYLEQCTVETVYDAPLLMRTNAAASLMSLPCSNANDARSLQRAFLPKGEKLTLTATLRNTAGNLWYETDYNGETCYIYCGDMEPIPEGNWFTRLMEKWFG